MTVSKAQLLVGTINTAHTKAVVDKFMPQRNGAATFMFNKRPALNDNVHNTTYNWGSDDKVLLYMY